MEVNRRKRKSCISPEPPRKSQKAICKTTEVAVEAMARGTKRRANSPNESPKKKKTGSDNVTDISDATEVSAQVATARGTKRKASNESESPKKMKRVCSNKVEICKPSTSLDRETKEDEEAESKKDLSAEQQSGANTPVGSSWSDDSLSSFSSSSNAEKDTYYTIETSGDFEAKYVQTHRLGEGGFGSVYAGYRKSDDLPVAIKHISKEDVKFRPMECNEETFLVPSEVMLMMSAGGGPESIGEFASVSVLDWCDLDDKVLLVMERPDPSMDLNHYLQKNEGPLDEDQAKTIMKQLVEAAIKMHSQGVFHRDIKLENILIETGSDVPRVRVIDFGCGCFVRNRPYHLYCGTVAYAPPEGFIQGRYEASPTTVWQLGVLLYELLKGHRQFTTSRFISKNKEFMTKLESLKVSKDCYGFLKMCMAVDPKQRATLEQMQQHPWFK